METMPEKYKKLETSGWSRFRQWLGIIASTSQREDNGTVGNSNQKLQDVEEGITLEAVRDSLNEVERVRAARTPGRFPKALELGPQRYTDPKFWGPENGGIPLAEDENYQAALRLLDHFEPAHVSAQRYRAQRQP